MSILYRHYIQLKMSSLNTCERCNKTFKNPYILKQHQKTAKYCLNLNTSQSETSYVCEYCQKDYSTKHYLQAHYAICYEKSIHDLKFNYENKLEILESSLNDKKRIISEKEEEIKNLKKEKDDEIKILKEENLNLIKLMTEYKSKYETKDDMIERFEELAKRAIDNTGNKTIKTINHNRNNIYQNLQPLTNTYMEEQSKLLKLDDVKDGAFSLASFAAKHTFKDRIACTDFSRKKFVFKNEDDEIIADPEGIKVTKKFIEINKHALIVLFEEYYQDVKNKLQASTDLDYIQVYLSRLSDIEDCLFIIDKGELPIASERYEKFKKNFIEYLLKHISLE